MPLITKIKQGTQDVLAKIQVRAFIAVSFSLGIIGGFFAGKVTEQTFTSIALVAITWYFTKRQSKDEIDQNGNGTG